MITRGAQTVEVPWKQMESMLTGGGGDDVVVERWLQPLCWKLL